MEQITAAMIFEFIALLGGGIAAWTKINQEVTLLKSRIINLEKRENDMAKKGI
jgi:prefoldin subunit 5